VENDVNSGGKKGALRFWLCLKYFFPQTNTPNDGDIKDKLNYEITIITSCRSTPYSVIFGIKCRTCLTGIKFGSTRGF
jgi:hypothetical protein